MKVKMFDIDELKHAYTAGVYSQQMSRDSLEHDEIEEAFTEYLIEAGIEEKEVEEENIPISYAWIKLNCGWSAFCDISGSNHYSIKEFGEPPMNTSYNVTLSQAKQLRFIV